MRVFFSNEQAVVQSTFKLGLNGGYGTYWNQLLKSRPRFLKLMVNAVKGKETFELETTLVDALISLVYKSKFTNLKSTSISNLL